MFPVTSAIVILEYKGLRTWEEDRVTTNSFKYEIEFKASGNSDYNGEMLIKVPADRICKLESKIVTWLSWLSTPPI